MSAPHPDDHADDDVTQATLHQAVARGNLQPGPLGGWLRTVLVNFARQWRRGERRRETPRAIAQRTRPPAIDEFAARNAYRWH